MADPKHDGGAQPPPPPTDAEAESAMNGLFNLVKAAGDVAVAGAKTGVQLVKDVTRRDLPESQVPEEISAEEASPAEQAEDDAWGAEDTAIDAVPPVAGGDAADETDDEEDTLA